MQDAVSVQAISKEAQAILKEAQAILKEAQARSWSTLTGAYGPSDGTDHARDIPAMLEVLATQDDVNAASWGDAYDDALLGHVWHRYSIYPVTPEVVGFVVRIATARMKSAPEVAFNLALAVRLIAETANGHRRAQDAERRVLGEATATALQACRAEIRQWYDTPLAESAIVVGQFIPELHLDR